jgi:hypothetical protein
MSTITHLARVPGKELPQEVPLKPIPVCPSPAVADLHDAHSHPGFTMRQHSAHVENPPVPCEAFVLQQIVHALRRSYHPKVAGRRDGSRISLALISCAADRERGHFSTSAFGSTPVLLPAGQCRVGGGRSRPR